MFNILLEELHRIAMVSNKEKKVHIAKVWKAGPVYAWDVYKSQGKADSFETACQAAEDYLSTLEARIKPTAISVVS